MLRRIAGGQPSMQFFIGAILLLLLYLVGSPLVCLLLSSFRPGGLPLDPGWTWANYVETYTSAYTYRLLGNSLLFSLGSSAVALFLGTNFAWFLERTDVPLRGALKGMILSTMAIPPIILAVSWVLLLSPKIGFFNHLLMEWLGLASSPLNVYSLPGMIFVQGLALVPTTLLILAPAFRNMDPNLEEAALTSGAGMFTLVRTIVLPILLPALLSAAIFVFIVGLVVFDIPGIIGLPVRIMVFSSEIYFATHPPSGLAQYGTVSTLAMSYIAFTFATMVLYHRMTRRSQQFTTITGKGFRPRPFRLGKWKPVVFGYFLLYFFLAIAAPLGILIWTSLLPYYSKVSVASFGLLSLDNYRIFFTNRKVILALTNTLVVAFVSAMGVSLLSFAISWIVVRLRLRISKLLDTLAFIPLGIPHVLMGLALIYVYLTVRFIPIYGTIWIIVVAYVTHYIAFGTRTINGAMVQVHRELEEASQVSGATWLQTFLRIIFPLLIPAIASVWIWVGGHAMRELSAALMLASGRNILLSTLLWGFWEGGDMPVAAAVGVVLITLLILLMGAALLLSRRSRLRY
jgi:iron(III) transport system permease protein